MKMLMVPTLEGVESTGGDSGSVSPLWSPSAAACWIYAYVSLISVAVASAKPWGSYIFLGQIKSVGIGLKRIRRTTVKRMSVAPPVGEGMPPALESKSFVSFWPTSAHFVCLKIYEAWPWPWPFWSLVAPGKLITLKRGVYRQTELESNERGLFRKCPKTSKNMGITLDKMQIFGNMLQ
jgi:hypothetical protein